MFGVENQTQKREQQIVNIAKALKASVDKYGGVHSSVFCEKEDDCYDGLNLSSYDVVAFAQALMAAKQAQNFIENPDILKHTKRAVSCGNSSCLYLVIPFSKVSPSEDVIHSIEFLNKIFDVIFPDTQVKTVIH